MSIIVRPLAGVGVYWCARPEVSLIVRPERGRTRQFLMLENLTGLRLRRNTFSINWNQSGK
ncbi:MAG: hypothetical protein AVDCRST_MAG95-2661 [uncultured Adhaeribacter sp.]|uniref:Uncharacterized protein n=1 Tax=uncultured Adhaeribacter sp. TaxID=448109 RepID=A0A6J4J2J8_9BACT|nr:MAG: hypothetical protein AVDCRST_MAG95-2661 [uncultured Adhaeribacter sp.]